MERDHLQGMCIWKISLCEEKHVVHSMIYIEDLACELIKEFVKYISARSIVHTCPCVCGLLAHGFPAPYYCLHIDI